MLKVKADQYAHAVYKLWRKLPPDEKFGLTSQLRRAGLSVPLNIIEGYARQSVKSETQFLIIAFGSLKESLYLLDFAVTETYLTPAEIVLASQIGEELAKLLWTKIQRFKSQIAAA
ncbi:MAG: four helix bundle protein [Patescibacteria group bacterium]